ncbi:MAG: NTP transferase domain-containing protein [Oscillospiraceae bacterium]|jgi:UDP-N-acetylglucosamine diphosphorylase/glucosamine-1-phosphate N-acetyltransferase|nr:NTP transferase domain-containing protein [Oscillospiraceae bacterium]
MVKIRAVVLAAGRGTRLGGDTAKVLREANGKTLLSYVVDALSFVPREDIIIVAGYKKEDVFAAFPDCAFAVQEKQLGTGHAVLSAEDKLAGFDGVALVCCGDMPLLRRETYLELLETHSAGGNDCTILSGVAENPYGFGRIVRGEGGGFAAIVEEKDCTPEQRGITEINAGVYVFDAQKLLPALHSLSTANAQEEYYLTDAPAIIKSGGGRVGVYRKALGDEMLGVNTAEQLAQVERILRLLDAQHSFVL